MGMNDACESCLLHLSLFIHSSHRRQVTALTSLPPTPALAMSIFLMFAHPGAVPSQRFSPITREAEPFLLSTGRLTFLFFCCLLYHLPIFLIFFFLIDGWFVLT